jgi:hypothetical protein
MFAGQICKFFSFTGLLLFVLSPSLMASRPDFFEHQDTTYHIAQHPSTSWSTLARINSSCRDAVKAAQKGMVVIIDFNEIPQHVDCLKRFQEVWVRGLFTRSSIMPVAATVLNITEFTPAGPISGDQLAHLATLTKMRKLTIAPYGADNSHFFFLQKLTHLEYLDVYTNEWSNLRSLEGLKKLRTLFISYRHYPFILVNDRQVSSLLHVTSLNKLFIQYSNITDQGLEVFKQLPHLTKLYLPISKISLEGASYFARTHINRVVIDDRNTPEKAQVTPLLRAELEQQENENED